MRIKAGESGWLLRRARLSPPKIRAKRGRKPVRPVVASMVKSSEVPVWGSVFQSEPRLRDRGLTAEKRTE